MDMSAYPAVVLAAGEGRRLAPLTDTRPKPMLSVANRPILEYVLEAIAEAGIESVLLVVGYRAERIRTHVGDGDDWGLDVTYIEQSPQLGTGHAILQAEAHVDGPFLVFNGDRIVDASAPGSVIAAHRDGEAVVSTTVVKHPSTFGVVEVDGDDLVGIEEKPLDPSPQATINAGVYAFDPTIFDRIHQTEPINGEQTITETLDAMAADGHVRAVRYEGRWLDISHLWDLTAVTTRLVSDGPTELGPGAHVAESASIATDVAIGADARVESNATIAGGTALGPSSTVGASAVIENAVVMADATIEPGAVVRDAIIGANATVGANATIGGGSATVVIEGSVHEEVTLGGVVGDNATVGHGSTLAAGTIVGLNSTIDEGVALGGWIDAETEVRRG